MELIHRGMRVESDSLEDAVRRHEARLIGRLALIVGDREEARDLTQQTFLRAAEHWPIGSDDEVARWLSVVSVRLALNERRRRRRWGFLPVAEDDSSWALKSDPDLWLALARLDRRIRAALILNVVEGYTQDQIADLMGVRRGTVASWLSRARTGLRAELEERE
jgi:RNA polymerase sigma-70 factor (ECF subfamily)